VSKGAQQLLAIVREIYPNQRVEFEHNVAERGGLYVDIYLPRLHIAFEYDGIQHFKFIEHFHSSKQGFIQARKRDLRKNTMCEDLGITLVRVAYDEPMTKEDIMQKIDQAFKEELDG